MLFIKKSFVIILVFSVIGIAAIGCKGGIDKGLREDVSVEGAVDEDVVAEDEEGAKGEGKPELTPECENVTKGTPCKANDGDVCDGEGACVKLNGKPCDSGAECESSNCVDGLCCDDTCEGVCRSCNITGKEGACTPIAAATDPDDECAMGGVCDGSGACASGEFLWSKQFGDANMQQVRDVATDTSGNIVIVGIFDGTVNFGGSDLLSVAGGPDMFVAKFAPNGNHIWSKHFGDADDQYANNVAIDRSGNVIVAGTFKGTVNFGSGNMTTAGNSDIFVAKFDPNGNHLWSKQFGDASSQYASGLAVDASGNFVMTGFFHGSVNFGGNNNLITAGDEDSFVAKFNPSGNHLWSKNFGDSNGQWAEEVAIDSQGNLVIAGVFDGTINFGGSNLTSVGTDIFMAKLDPSGNHIWSKHFGEAGLQYAMDVLVDASGNVVMAGVFDSSVNFGGENLVSAGHYDIFVAKFDSNANHIWSKRFGGSDSQYLNSIASDGLGNIVMAGSFETSVQFSDTPQDSAGDRDIFIAKLASNGVHLWSYAFGDMKLQEGKSVAIDKSGNSVLIGYFKGALSFRDGIRISAGDDDIFMAKFKP